MEPQRKEALGRISPSATAEDTQVGRHRPVVREEFLPPTAQNLGISTDPNQKLPVTVVVTDNP